jgi:hypothetical protein
MDEKLKAKIIAALDAADTMYAEFMTPSTDISGQYHIYKSVYPKVKAARKALEKA